MLDYSEMYGLSQITLGTFRNMVNLLSETAYENQQMIKVLVQPDTFLKVTSFILLMAERNKIKFLRKIILVCRLHKRPLQFARDLTCDVKKSS